MKASVIISVYKDVEALNCVLYGLTLQTEKDFEVIVTEDGEDPAMATYLKERAPKALGLRHLTQEDLGFRKTRAVNRAVASARSEYLIFLDGDCIPHPDFVKRHMRSRCDGNVLVGRRMHLGFNISKAVRRDPLLVNSLQTWPSLLRNFIKLHLDSVRNYEVGAPSVFFHSLFSRKELNLVGCNFSCSKKDFFSVNGYDESLPGIGAEDDDLCLRMKLAGVAMRNVKFLAVCYHLYHEYRRHNFEINKHITANSLRKKQYYCAQGVASHHDA